MLEKATTKGEAKQSLELPHKTSMKTIVNPYRHTIYSIYSAHYFYNIALYPLHFSIFFSRAAVACAFSGQNGLLKLPRALIGGTKP